MPVKACPNGKWKIGNGKCIYKSKASAVRAYQAYLAKHPEKADEIEENGLPGEIEEEDCIDARREYYRKQRWARRIGKSTLKDA